MTMGSGDQHIMVALVERKARLTPISKLQARIKVDAEGSKHQSD